MSADRDGAGWRTRENRRKKDIVFLETVNWCIKHGDYAALWRMALALRKGPRWRQVVLERAAKRIAESNSPHQETK